MTLQEIVEIIDTHPEMNEMLVQLLVDEVTDMRLAREISEFQTQVIFDALAA